MSAPMIAVLDYGMGNRRSVEKALGHVGAAAVVTGDAERVGEADGIVIPGVGAFPRAMAGLRDRGLDGVLRERAGAGVPILGACLGMQLLFDRSSENEPTEGLGLLDGDVVRLETGGLKLPHIGWSPVRWERDHELTAGLPAACAFYHVHTYAPVPSDPEVVLGRAEYGAPFVSAVAHPERPIFGAQFHPEKSSRHGLALLRNFAALCARARAGALPA